MIEAAKATSPEIGAAIARGVFAVLPVGALEQHGPHLPLDTDTVLATGVARRIASSVNALLLPAIAYGEAWTAEGWPGTLSLTAETIAAQVLEIGRGLQRMGVKGLVTLNGHFGNHAPIAVAAKALTELGFPVLALDYPGLERLAAEICETEPAGPGFYHADEVETSMMLALAPDSVHMDRAAPEYPDFPADFGQKPMQLSTFNRSGVFGDPRPATAEKGERLIAGIVAECLDLIAEWRK